MCERVCACVCVRAYVYLSSYIRLFIGHLSTHTCLLVPRARLLPAILYWTFVFPNWAPCEALLAVILFNSSNLIQITIAHKAYMIVALLNATAAPDFMRAVQYEVLPLSAVQNAWPSAAFGTGTRTSQARFTDLSHPVQRRQSIYLYTVNASVGLPHSLAALKSF